MMVGCCHLSLMPGGRVLRSQHDQNGFDLRVLFECQAYSLLFSALILFPAGQKIRPLGSSPFRLCDTQHWISECLVRPAPNPRCFQALLADLPNFGLYFPVLGLLASDCSSSRAYVVRESCRPRHLPQIYAVYRYRNGRVLPDVGGVLGALKTCL